MACRGNASFRGRGCPYPSFLSQVTKGHQARLPLRGARGGGTRGGGPRRLLPGRSGRGPAPEEERRLELEGPLTAGDSWQARGPRGGSVLGCPVRDPGRLQSKVRSSFSTPRLLPSPSVPASCLFKRSAGRPAS